jgi:hypothetical protein
MHLYCSFHLTCLLYLIETLILICELKTFRNKKAQKTFCKLKNQHSQNDYIDSDNIDSDNIDS